MMSQHSQARYELLTLIGAGGMGEVFRGRAIGAGGFCRSVAIKRIRVELAQDAHLGRWFQREALPCAKLEHPNIVSVLDFSRAPDGHMLIVMELVDGANLARLRHALGRCDLIPVPIAIFIVIELLRGLEHAHERNIIHRDISPHNVLLARTGAVKLSDFGVARSTEATESTGRHARRGKLRYLSPEQLHNWDVDHRADLFSVGVVLYELLTGSRPHASAVTDAEFMAGVLLSPVPPPSDIRPDIGPELDAITLRLLAKERGERFASAREVLDALDALSGPRAGTTQLAALVEQHVPREHPTLQVPAAEVVPAQGDHGAAPELSAQEAAEPPLQAVHLAVSEALEQREPPAPEVLPRSVSHAGLRSRPQLFHRRGVGAAAAAMFLVGVGALLAMALMPQGSSEPSPQASNERAASGERTASPSSSPVAQAPEPDAAPAPLPVHTTLVAVPAPVVGAEKAVSERERTGRADAHKPRPVERLDGFSRDDPAWPVVHGGIVRQ